MAHTIENRKPLLNRVKRIQGQLGSLERSLDVGTECTDVLQQIAAIRGAVNGLMGEVLEGHLRTHVAPVDGGDPQEMDELLRIIRAYMK